MKEYVIFSLIAVLLMAVWNTTGSVSGDIMKAVICVSICALIAYIWRF